MVGAPLSGRLHKLTGSTHAVQVGLQGRLCLAAVCRQKRHGRFQSECRGVLQSHF
jgi:hypothetical protein